MCDGLEQESCVLRRQRYLTLWRARKAARMLEDSTLTLLLCGAVIVSVRESTSARSLEDALWIHVMSPACDSKESVGSKVVSSDSPWLLILYYGICK